MSPTPRVSIVMPVFNDADTVSAAIDSCLAQTIADIEVICVDDASTDATPDIVAEHVARDARVRLIRQPRNLSAFQARRAGILAAKAEHVLFLDGDDELLPEAAEKSVAAALPRGVDLIGFGTEVLNPEGKVVGGYQKRLKHKHDALEDAAVLGGLFPIDRPAQGQLWRYLFRTQLLRDAHALLPDDLTLPRVNDLPLMFLVAALAKSYISIDDRLYRYQFGRGGSGQVIDSLEQAQFYAGAIRSVDSIAPAVRSIARSSSNPGALLDSYESVRQSIIGYVVSYTLQHTCPDLLPAALDHLHTCASATDIVLAAVRFYPDTLDALKRHSISQGLERRPVRSILLTTRTLTTGGVSGVLLTQAEYLLRAGYRVTIVARRYGSDPSAVPQGAHFVEMSGRGLSERLVEWAELCRVHDVDVIIDHQVLYSRDWPEYALTARTLGVETIGWLHNFAGRPIYDLNGLHALLKDNVPLLQTLVTLSPLDVAFWKLRGIPNTVFVPNPPSPMLLSADDSTAPKQAPEGRLELIWWGRLDEHTKKVSELLEVADRLRADSVDFHMKVVGPNWGDWSAARFNSLARERRLDGHVEAVGEMRGQRLLDAIDAADAFVTTSIIEGYQLTIPEAQSRGLPVFMYDLPWLTVVQENEGVVAVPQGDAAQLAREIASALRSPERYSELSRASIAAAGRALSYDFGGLYERVVNNELPDEFSPEPTLADAQTLLDLTIFYAEQHAGIRSRVVDVRSSEPTPEKVSATIGGAPAVGSETGGGVLHSLASLGQGALRVLPELRPFAHRVKRALGG